MKGDRGQTRREVEEHDRGGKTHIHLAGRGGNEKRLAMMRELDMTAQALGYRGGQHQSTLMQVNKHRHT